MIPGLSEALDRIAALERRLDSVDNPTGVDTVAPLYRDYVQGLGTILRYEDPLRNIPVVAYAVTGILLVDAFDGLYDDEWDLFNQDWYDENPLNSTTLNQCWIIDVTGATFLPTPNRWLGVLRQTGMAGPAGPFYVALITTAVSPPDSSWQLVTSDPTNVLNYPIIVVSSVALANGVLTINQAPDQPMQLSVIITDGGTAITAGILTLVDPTQGGSEVISLVGTTQTIVTEGFYTQAMLASVSGLVGGSSTTIEIEVYEYPAGELVNYSDDVWIFSELSAGPPTITNADNLGSSITAISDSTTGTAIVPGTQYTTGSYGQEMRPIVAIQYQSDTIGQTTPTLCQLWSATPTTNVTLTDGDGNSICVAIPNCAITAGACGAAPVVGTGPGGPGVCGGTVTAPSTLYAQLTWIADYFTSPPTCVPMNFQYASSPISDEAGSVFWASASVTLNIAAGGTATLYLEMHTECNDSEPLGYYTQASVYLFGIAGQQALNPSIYVPTDATTWFNGAGVLITNIVINTTPCSGGGNPIIAVGPCNPPTPSAGLTLSASRAGQLPVTYTLSQTSAFTLSGTFSITGVSGTFTNTITYNAASGTYWSSLVNSTAPTTFASSRISVSCSPFTVGSVTTSPIFGGDIPLTLSQPYGLTIASASTSTVVASSSTPTTSTNITITATLLDASSGPIANKLITLGVSGAGGGTGNGNTAITNSSGVATFTSTSSTKGSNAYSATDTTDGIAITATAAVTWSSGGGVSTTLTAGGSIPSVGLSPFPALFVASGTGITNGANLTIVSGAVTWTVVVGSGGGTTTLNCTVLSITGGSAGAPYSSGDAVT